MTKQRLVVFLWAANLGVVLWIWASTSYNLLGTGPDGILLSLGRLTGLLATYFALVQFLLMGRVLWIERQFGLDHLAGYHRLNGYATFFFLLLHPLFITGAYSLSSQTNFLAQYVQSVQQLPYVWMAFISQLLFIAVVVSSVYIVRRHLKFETWYWVHLLVYGAIVLAFFHQFALGGSFTSYPAQRNYWYALYAFVALNVLFYRFSLPSLNLLRHRFRVSRVVPETDSTTSVYISGRRLAKWTAKPGQFVLVRFLNLQFGKEEHPFSLSAVPQDDTFRLTIRHVGDYTSQIASLKPGTFALVSGPFGRFTKDLARTNKRLFIAGGVGITPLRTLAEEAVDEDIDSVLLYASRSENDIIFKEEIDALEGQGLRTTHILSDASGSPKRLDAKSIVQLVPDYKERDIFLCGPPPMMQAISKDLLELGFPADQLHYEQFSLHQQKITATQ